MPWDNGEKRQVLESQGLTVIAWVGFFSVSARSVLIKFTLIYWMKIRDVTTAVWVKHEAMMGWDEIMQFSKTQ